MASRPKLHSARRRSGPQTRSRSRSVMTCLAMFIGGRLFLTWIQSPIRSRASESAVRRREERSPRSRPESVQIHTLTFDPIWRLAPIPPQSLDFPPACSDAMEGVSSQSGLAAHAARGRGRQKSAQDRRRASDTDRSPVLWARHPSEHRSRVLSRPVRRPFGPGRP